MAPTQSYPRGTVLFRQDDDSRAVFLLSRGLVKLESICSDGRVAIAGLRSTGWILGAGAALREHRYVVAAVALTPCEAYRLPSTTFREQVRRNGALSWYLHHQHVEENLRGIDRVVGLSCLSARQRLQSLLGDLSTELLPGPRGVQIPLRDWEIAQLIAVTPTYVSRLITELIRTGRLSRRSGVLFMGRPTARDRGRRCEAERENGRARALSKHPRAS